MAARQEVPEEDRVYIREASEILDRRIGTLRKWESSGDLPKHLLPSRGKRGWRFWSQEQIQGIKDWLVATDRRPGKGVQHINELNADPAAVQAQIQAMRKPRAMRKSR